MDARTGKPKKPCPDDPTDGGSHNDLKTGTQTAMIEATATATRPGHTLRTPAPRWLSRTAPTRRQHEEGLESVARGAPLLPHSRGPSLFVHVDADPYFP